MNSNASATNNTAVGSEALSNNIRGYQNSALGSSSLRNNTEGHKNNAFGFGSLYNNTIGSHNSASGVNSLNFNETGNHNSSFGFSSLYFNNGSFNSAFGSASLYLLENGNSNLAFGSAAGRNIKSGDYNVFVGANAGSSDTTSNRNVYIGFDAGYGGYPYSDRLTNREGSIFIGYQSGLNELRSNRLYIENSDSVNPLIYGNFEDDSLKIHGSLSVKDEYTFPLMDGSVGQNIQTDGMGNLTWVSPQGPSSLIQDTDQDTKIVTESIADEDIIRIEANGSEVVTIEEDSVKIKNNLTVTGITELEDSVKVKSHLTVAGITELEDSVKVKKHLAVSGFTQLGDESPAIKLKTLVGTSPNAEGVSISIAHGLSPSKIINVAVYINNSAQNWIPPNYHGGDNYEYDYFFNHTSVVIKTMAANSANVINKPVKILITYTE